MPTFLATNAVMVTIIVINMILKEITIRLITWIGYDTHSLLMTKITNGVFYALFFNTAILLLLVQANFSDVFPNLGIFKGAFLDYTPKWYQLVGETLVSTMMLNAFMPPVYEAMTVVQTWLFQRMDQGWEKDKVERIYKTKTTQIYAYLDLYTGPDYIVHYKYSTLLNIIFVTMMYGLGLPILFPIAIISFFFFWATERYQIAYCYQLPPAMDDTMTKNALDWLALSPIFFLFNGFWMLGNRQMFENIVNSVPTSDVYMSTGHDLSTIGTVSQATPMLIIGVALSFIAIMQVVAYDTLRKWGFTLSSNVIEVDENLPNFFNAVKLSDADWAVKECQYYDERYGFCFIRREIVERLDKTELAKKPITGIAWYNILANPRYVREFNYIPIDVEDRDNLIVDGDANEGNDCEQSDMVSILINLAYVNTETAKNFKFAPGFSTTFLESQKANQ